MNHSLNRRQLLASMMVDESGGGGSEEDRSCPDVIPFTVVSEPNDDENDDDDDIATATADDECEDLGSAVVRLKDILDRGRDVVDEEFPVYSGAAVGRGKDDSTSDAGKTVVGHLRLSVECLATLKKVKAEMDAAMSLNASAGLTEANSLTSTSVSKTGTSDKSRSLVT